VVDDAIGGYRARMMTALAIPFRQDPANTVPAVAAEPPGVYLAAPEDLFDAYQDPVHIAWLVGYLVLVWILLCAPLLGARGRKRGAAVLGIMGVVPLAMLAIHGVSDRTLTVVNPFPRGEDGKPFLYVMDTVTAPGWQWPLVVLGALWVPALLLWARAGRTPRAPQPAVYALILGVWFIGLRVGVQLTAGPEPVDFATRINHFALHLMPFIALYAGRRGAGFFGLLLHLLIASLLFRGLLVGWSYAATVYDLGTWLDMNALTDMNPAVDWIDPMDFRDASPTAKWWSATALPQLTFWVLAGVVVGAVVGFIPWLVGRRNPDV